MKYRITISEQTTYEVVAENEEEAYEKAHCHVAHAGFPPDGVKITHQETSTTDGPEMIKEEKGTER